MKCFSPKTGFNIKRKYIKGKKKTTIYFAGWKSFLVFLDLVFLIEQNTNNNNNKDVKYDSNI